MTAHNETPHLSPAQPLQDAVSSGATHRPGESPAWQPDEVEGASAPDAFVGYLYEAAPDMYAALVNALQAVRIMHDTLMDYGGGKMPSVLAVMEQSKAALAKATGGAE